MAAGEVHQGPVGRGFGQEARIAYHDEAEAGARQGYVELTVDGQAIFFEGSACEQPHLPRAADGEAADDVVALAALVSLYGVYRYAAQGGYAGAGHGVPYLGYLGAEGHDYTQCGVGVEFVAAEAVYPGGRGGRHQGLGWVGLRGGRGRGGGRRGHEGRAALAQEAGYAVGGAGCRPAAGLRLVGQGHLGKPSAVESGVGEGGNVPVHASLAGQHVDVAWVVAVGGLEGPQQPFEEGAAAVGQSGGAQAWLRHVRVVLGLQHDGRQLLVVADEHEAVYGGAAVGRRGGQ